MAGMGKRLRPLTLKMPKALVPLAGRPLLSHILEEATESGIKKVFFIISPQHAPHFREYMKIAASLFPSLDIATRFQERAYGNGHAILEAASYLHEPFAVRYCDDVLLDDEPVLKSLVSRFARYRAPIITLLRIPRRDISRYGVVAVEKSIGDSIHKLRGIIEKPNVLEAERNREKLSNLAVMGAYIVTPKIIGHLKNISPYAPELDDALTLTAGFHEELMAGGSVYGWEFSGKRLDCGTLEGFLEAEEHLTLGGSR